MVIAVKTDKTLRKLSNLFLVSLAIADLLVSVKMKMKDKNISSKFIKVALFVMPFAIINDMTGKWPLGREACKIWIRYPKRITSHYLKNCSQ